MDVAFLEHFAFFSLTKIDLYASHFVFNPQLNAHFTILSFCCSRIAKCLLPRKISMCDPNACLYLITLDLYLQHGAGESLGG